MKSMKSNTNAFGLLLEGFRQCKMIGILALIITVLGAALLPIQRMVEFADVEGFTVEAFNAWSINPLMLAVIVAAPLMTLVLFHFLDNRAASDLYHALPHKRITLYCCYAGAVLLWTLLLIVVSSLISMIFCGVAHNYVKLLYDTILPYAASVFLISMLLVSGILIGMGLSGTVFTNVILAALLLFLPRFCYVVLRASVYTGLPFVSDVPSGGLMADNNNLLFSMCTIVLGLDNDASASDVFHPGWQPVVYTLVLVLIYLALGAWIFCRRRSEAAGQSAPSRMHQHVYRIIVTMAYCIFVTALLMDDMMDDISNIDGSSLLAYIMLYLIGVLIYFVYELITTRKWRNLLTALPGLAVVAVLNVGLAFGMHLVQEDTIDQRPSVSEIESISIDPRHDTYYDYSTIDLGTYVQMQTQDIQITDPAAISLVSYYLNENVETWKQGAEAYYNKYYSYYNSSNGETGYYSYSVLIRTDHKELFRFVRIPASESDKILNALESNADYVSAWQNPPEPIEKTMYISNDSVGLEQDQVEAIFEIYQQELQAAPFEQLYLKVSEYDSEEMDITYSYSSGGSVREIYCPVYADLMPKTLEAYYQALYEAQDDVLEKLDSAANSGDCTEIDIDAYYGNINTYCYSYDNSAAVKELYTNLKPYLLDEPVQPDGAYVQVTVYREDYSSQVYLYAALDQKFFADPYVQEHYESTGGYTEVTIDAE